MESTEEITLEDERVPDESKEVLIPDSLASSRILPPRAKMSRTDQWSPPSIKVQGPGVFASSKTLTPSMYQTPSSTLKIPIQTSAPIQPQSSQSPHILPTEPPFSERKIVNADSESPVPVMASPHSYEDTGSRKKATHDDRKILPETTKKNTAPTSPGRDVQHVKRSGAVQKKTSSPSITKEKPRSVDTSIQKQDRKREGIMTAVALRSLGLQRQQNQLERALTAATIKDAQLHRRQDRRDDALTKTMITELENQRRASLWESAMVRNLVSKQNQLSKTPISINVRVPLRTNDRFQTRSPFHLGLKKLTNEDVAIDPPQTIHHVPKKEQAIPPHETRPILFYQQRMSDSHKEIHDNRGKYARIPMAHTIFSQEQNHTRIAQPLKTQEQHLSIGDRPRVHLEQSPSSSDRHREEVTSHELSPNLHSIPNHTTPSSSKHLENNQIRSEASKSAHIELPRDTSFSSSIRMNDEGGRHAKSRREIPRPTHTISIYREKLPSNQTLNTRNNILRMNEEGGRHGFHPRSKDQKETPVHQKTNLRNIILRMNEEGGSHGFHPRSRDLKRISHTQVQDVRHEILRMNAEGGHRKRMHPLSNERRPRRVLVIDSTLSGHHFRLSPKQNHVKSSAVSYAAS
jgi:hypothetical protein